MRGDGAKEPLAVLGGLLDDLRTTLDETHAARLDAPVRQYVERALEAAVAAASRARHNNLGAEADGPVGQTAAAARGLLEELRASVARAQSILERSGRLRRHAVELSAAALLLRRQSERLSRRASASTDVPGDLRGVRVLVVESGTEAARGLSASLSALGAEVRAARSVPDALDAYLAILPDVLVCDVAVSGVRGLDLVRELREKGALAPAVAVAMTVDGETCRKARAAGFDEVLASSVAPAQFAATILGVLRK
jgi:CheY-like chemotaxis protein